MNQIRLVQVTTAALMLCLAGCSEAPSAPAKAPVEKPEPVTGRTALFRMYQVARSWAPDCQVLKLNGMHLTEVPDTPGKAGAWEATFVSATRGSAHSYTWSAIDNPETNLHKGVFQTAGQSSSTGSDKPFLIAAAKIDSDSALETARTKSAEYDKKAPGLPISFLLEQTGKFPNPAWRVIWGESVAVSGFSVFIDASTGDFLAIMH